MENCAIFTAMPFPALLACALILTMLLSWTYNISISHNQCPFSPQQSFDSANLVTPGALPPSSFYFLLVAALPYIPPIFSLMFAFFSSSVPVDNILSPFDVPTRTHVTFSYISVDSSEMHRYIRCLKQSLTFGRDGLPSAALYLREAEIPIMLTKQLNMFLS